jgi:hypothetical protein
MVMMIRSSAGCLLNVINYALDAAAVDQQKQVAVRLRGVYLWRIAEAVVRVMQPLVKEDVTLLNCISKALPPVRTDGSRVMQVGGDRGGAMWHSETINQS